MHSSVKKDQNDEINFKEVFNFALRNKITISLIAISSLIISTLYSLSIKKLWQGEFEIVLKKDNRAEINLMERIQKANFAKSGLIELGLIDNQLQTDVEILKSPLLLFEVFSFVKDEKIKINPKEKTLKFNSWRKESIDIFLKEDTSVVKFYYRDNNKNLIIPVLNKVSESFQKYSVNNKRTEAISIAEKYFKSELDKYKKLSKKSFKEFQLFAIDNDLSITNTAQDNDERLKLSKIAPVGTIDKQRVDTANEVRFFENFLGKLEKVETSSGQLEYLTYLFPDFPEERFVEIRELDNELNSLSNSYDKNDPIVKEILLSKRIAREELKKDVVGVLKALKTKSQLYKNALTRSEDVLMEYQELYLESAKDRITLDELENQYRVFKLIKSYPEYEWELITKPNLLDSPIAPNKKRIIAIGTVIGFLASILISLLKEKKMDIVYSKNKFISYFPFPLISELPKNTPDKWDEIINILITQIESENKGNLTILKIGSIESNKINKINSILKKVSKNKDLKVSSSILDIANTKNLLLITELGITKNDECKYFLNSLKLKISSTLGFVIIT